MLNLLCLVFLSSSVSISYAQKKKDEPKTYSDDFSFQWKSTNDTLTLIAKNKLLTPITITFQSRKDNTELQSFVLYPKDSTTLLKYSGKTPDSIYKGRIKDSLKIGYYWGHKSLIKPNLHYLYRLPFKKGKAYEVTQSFNGKASHNNIISKYAIDFQLNVGEKVYAAREGIVVKVIDWFTKQGGEELKHAANKIVILHSDGTMATYAHLDYKGSLVKEGQDIKRGQKIGISGLTGDTSGPHLHFVVRKENDIAIPIYFEGYKGKILKRRKRYKVAN